MKKIISIILIMFSIGAHAQSIVVKYKYCRVTSGNAPGFKKTFKLSIDYGYIFNTKDVANKVEVDTALDKINDFTSDIVMLNYLSRIGWECFSIASHVGGGGGSVGTSLVYYFRKPLTE